MQYMYNKIDLLTKINSSKVKTKEDIKSEIEHKINCFFHQSLNIPECTTKVCFWKIQIIETFEIISNNLLYIYQGYDKDTVIDCINVYIDVVNDNINKINAELYKLNATNKRGLMKND